MSRKSERLVNLTIALLASKRFITKSEIFRTVEGYEGEPDARERMFERDKDELRNLGIEIEVGSFDPLFEDEPGYRILTDKYAIQLKDLTPVEYSLLVSAAQLWRDDALSEHSFGALIKLKALGINVDYDSLPHVEPIHIGSPVHIGEIVEAISDRKVLTFSYLSLEATLEEREIEPYGLTSQNGFWYLAGRDLAKNGLRIFRLDRMASQPLTKGRARSYEIPENFSIGSLLEDQPQRSLARIKVRSGKAHSLRAKAIEFTVGDTWDVITVPYGTIESLIASALWHGDDLQILEPQEAVDSIQDALKKLVTIHG